MNRQYANGNMQNSPKGENLYSRCVSAGDIELAIGKVQKIQFNSLTILQFVNSQKNK